MTAAELVDILIKIPANKRKNYVIVDVSKVTVDRDKQTITVHYEEEK